jgi:hypothetical protein
MIDKETGGILPPVIVRDKEDVHTLNIKIDVEDFYNIINAMNEGCGCFQCRKLSMQLGVALSKANRDHRNEVTA